MAFDSEAYAPTLVQFYFAAGSGDFAFSRRLEPVRVLRSLLETAPCPCRRRHPGVQPDAVWKAPFWSVRADRRGIVVHRLAGVVGARGKSGDYSADGTFQRVWSWRSAAETARNPMEQRRDSAERQVRY